MSDKTYIIETKGGMLRKVTVPEAWKVTFGPLMPGTRGDQALALRFYEAGDKQRAVFVDVKSFRDASIPVRERVTKTKAQRVRRDAPGGAKDVVMEARITEWRDPDGEEVTNTDEDFLELSFDEVAEKS